MVLLGRKIIANIENTRIRGLSWLKRVVFLI